MAVRRPSGMTDEAWDIWKRIAPNTFEKLALHNVGDSVERVFYSIEDSRLLLAAYLFMLQKQQKETPQHSVIYAEGFNNVHDYAAEKFKLGRSTVSLYIKIAKTVLDLEGFTFETADHKGTTVVHSIFYKDIPTLGSNEFYKPKDFTITQLSVMTALAKNTRAMEGMHDLVKQGCVCPYTTTISVLTTIVNNLVNTGKRVDDALSGSTDVTKKTVCSDLLTAIATYCSMRQLNDDEQSVCDAFIDLVKSEGV